MFRLTSFHVGRRGLPQNMRTQLARRNATICAAVVGRRRSQELHVARFKASFTEGHFSHSNLTLKRNLAYKCPTEIDPTPAALHDLVREATTHFANEKAVICGVSGRSVTYKELQRNIDALSTSLRKLGVKKGDVVLTNSINCIEYVTLIPAILQLGAIISPASPQFRASEVESQMKDCGAKFLVTHEAVKDAALEAGKACGLSPEHMVVISQGDSTPYHTFQRLLDIPDDEIDVREVDVDLTKDIAVLPYSSGTTAAPKGVMLSHYNLVTNLRQGSEFETRDVGDRSLLLLPMFHAYGFYLVFLNIYQGLASVTLPKFDKDLFLKTLEKYKIKKAHVVPPIILMMSVDDDVKRYDLSHLEYFISAAAPLSDVSEKAVHKKLGLKVKQAYGMTELSPVASYTKDGKVVPGSVGQIVSSTEAKIVDLATGEDVGFNEVGELLIRGPQVMLGYLNRPDATAATIQSDGFLATGDIGYLTEDGYLFITDRIKDLIKYKGHQVCPTELEAVLLGNEHVADAAVLASTDARGEEIPKAYVVLRNGANISEEQLAEYVASKVAPFKKIREFEFVDQIPRSASGKILRRMLK